MLHGCADYLFLLFFIASTGISAAILAIAVLDWIYRKLTGGK